MTERTMLKQADLARAFEVSGTTVREWTQAGLPCRREGRETLYDVGIVLHWYGGRECRLRNTALQGRRFTPAEQIALGWMLGVKGRPDAESKSRFAAMMQSAGFTDADTWDAYGLARGLYAAHY